MQYCPWCTVSLRIFSSYKSELPQFSVWRTFFPCHISSSCTTVGFSKPPSAWFYIFCKPYGFCKLSSWKVSAAFCSGAFKFGNSGTTLSGSSSRIHAFSSSPLGNDSRCDRMWIPWGKWWISQISRRAIRYWTTWKSSCWSRATWNRRPSRPIWCRRTAMAPYHRTAWRIPGRSSCRGNPHGAYGCSQQSPSSEAAEERTPKKIRPSFWPRSAWGTGRSLNWSNWAHLSIPWWITGT